MKSRTHPVKAEEPYSNPESQQYNTNMPLGIRRIATGTNSTTAHTGNNAPATHVPPPPPNGGYGWMCTACVALINAHTWGLNASYSIFLAHYLASNTFPNATPLKYAFVGSLSVSCALLVSPIATTCVRTYGTKSTMLVGVLLETTGLISASFATQIWHLFLTQGFIFGTGMGLLFTPCAGIIPQWFTTRRSLANGLSSCGSSLGGVLYSFATGTMIRNIGLAWTFRVLGILAFVVNSGCTLIIKDRHAIIGSSQLAFDATLLKRPEFLLLLGFGSFSVLGYVVLNFSLVDYANKIGLENSQAVLIGALFSLGQAIGRPTIGYFSDETGRFNISTISTLLAGIFSLVIWVLAKGYGILAFFAVISGCVGGTFWTTIGPLTAEVVGLRTVPSALCLVWLAIVPAALLSEPIALQIFTGTGNYLGTQLFAGSMFVLAAVCLGILRGWKIGEVNEVARILKVEPRNIDRVKVDSDLTLSDHSRKVGRERMIATCWKIKKV
jgi:MFS family permease